ncbi:hypothetical protein NP233_g10190 [Leucocoprinus birnbaumii]|uniref:Uncharacterized protein n=1 Tax=Leucocoprinus birnbaumii TaxID=56174 RepID=A0AAD5YS43_9AGAR|nr:hypothetical protein NP233_g10190 [Leucocoprinus birnbaumii]
MLKPGNGRDGYWFHDRIGRNGTLYQLYSASTAGMISFTLPEEARALHYYGMTPSPPVDICIDDCAVSVTAGAVFKPEFADSALLYSMQLSPGIHKVEMTAETIPDSGSSGLQVFSLARIDLEVAGPHSSINSVSMPSAFAKFIADRSFSKPTFTHA